MFGEMFEALIGAIYLESDRSFSVTYDWFQTQCSRVTQEKLAPFRESI
jgi:dsRNA-specific ribonuclease